MIRARGTIWGHRSDTAGGSGMGKPFNDSVTERADFLRAYSKTCGSDKHTGKCFTLGCSTTGGSTDRECKEVFGLLLDSDESGEYRRLMHWLDSRNIAYIFQIKPPYPKFHASIWYAIPMIPSLVHKDVYRHVVGHLISEFSKIAGVKFDPSIANRYLGLTYCARETLDRPDAKIETLHREGEGLDVAAFCAETGYVDIPALPPAPALDLTQIDDTGFVPMSPEETLERVRRCTITNRIAERGPILRAIAEGKPFAQHGQNDNTLQRACSWLAFFTGGRGDLETLLEYVLPSAIATSPDRPHEEWILGKLRRALRDAWTKTQARAAQDQRIKATLLGQNRQ